MSISPNNMGGTLGMAWDNHVRAVNKAMDMKAEAYRFAKHFGPLDQTQVSALERRLHDKVNEAMEAGSKFIDELVKSTDEAIAYIDEHHKTEPPKTIPEDNEVGTIDGIDPDAYVRANLVVVDGRVVKNRRGVRVMNVDVSNRRVTSVPHLPENEVAWGFTDRAQGAKIVEE